LSQFVTHTGLYCSKQQEITFNVVGKKSLHITFNAVFQMSHNSPVPSWFLPHLGLSGTGFIWLGCPCNHPTKSVTALKEMPRTEPDQLPDKPYPFFTHEQTIERNNCSPLCQLSDVSMRLMINPTKLANLTYQCEFLGFAMNAANLINFIH